MSERDPKIQDKAFLTGIQKRIRKDLRINKLLDTKKKYKLYDDKTCRTTILIRFLEEIFNKRLEFTLVNKNPDIVPNTLDMQISTFFNEFLENKEFEKEKIAPLRTITENEIQQICKILDLKYNSVKTNEILDKIESKYPGTKFATNRTKMFIKNKKIKKFEKD